MGLECVADQGFHGCINKGLEVVRTPGRSLLPAFMLGRASEKQGTLVELNAQRMAECCWGEADAKLLVRLRRHADMPTSAALVTGDAQGHQDSKTPVKSVCPLTKRAHLRASADGKGLVVEVVARGAIVEEPGARWVSTCSTACWLKLQREPCYACQPEKSSLHLHSTDHSACGCCGQCVSVTPQLEACRTWELDKDNPEPSSAWNLRRACACSTVAAELMPALSMVRVKHGRTRAMQEPQNTCMAARAHHRRIMAL